MAELTITIPDEHVAEVIEAITEQMSPNVGEGHAAHAERFLITHIRRLVLRRRRRIAEEESVVGIVSPF